MDNLKRKKCTGPDNVPLIFLRDGATQLLGIVTFLMNQVFFERKIPRQWKEAKIIPLHKRGKKDVVENYRPISNLNSITKIFEMLVKNRIKEIEESEGIDLTGNNQHGFKPGRSTITACLDLQQRIAEAADDGSFVAVASTDLTAAFDVVNFSLLLKRLNIMGLPKYLIDLTEDWLTHRSAFVQLGEQRSEKYDIEAGTIQGSINGPDYFSMFISPLLKTKPESLMGYADDSYEFSVSTLESEAIKKCSEETSKNIVWMNSSGLVTNPAKTSACVFSRRSTTENEMCICDAKVPIQQTLKVLGITFDRKLNWNHHLEISVKKAMKSKQGIGLIANCLNSTELKILATSLFYSRLYYGAGVWLSQTTSKSGLKKLERASTSMLRIVHKNNYSKLPPKNLHSLFQCATPEQSAEIHTAKTLHRVLHDTFPDSVLTTLTYNFTENRRHKGLLFTSSNKSKIGENCLGNRVSEVSKKLSNDWNLMNASQFKSYAKKILRSDKN
jgi:hypothetical protein